MQWKLANVIPLLKKKIDTLKPIIIQFHFYLVYQNYVKKLPLKDYMTT
jgi:hypothetical protein